MEDREIGLFWREWFLEKQKDSQASPEDYLIRTYLEWHEKDPLGEAEKRARIKERIQTWKETRDGFLRMIDRYPDTAGMEEWQAAQMLENVMQELQLDRADACRYLANVKKMIYDNLLFAVGEPAASALRPDFEKSYEEAWQNADLADESALSLLFSETVSLMRYAGLSFEEDTQRILAELSQLDMPRVQFSCRFQELELTPNGADGVAFYMSANAGEALKPMSKVASGGELARIMLAMKNVLAEKDQVNTLIFDEVDTGVSGRAAQKVAEKLRSVASHKQVLCVTHLPQLAALADTHLLIAKSERDGRTYTSVTPLDLEGRKRELARIIGGANITQTTLKSAEEMLRR